MPKKKSCIIYGLYDPETNELRYIGKTAQTLKLRLRGHCKPSSRKSGTHLYNWINSIFDRGLKPTIKEVETVPFCEQNEAERHWIAYFRDRGHNLTNYTDGGSGGDTRSGAKITQEHIDKLQAGLKEARSNGKIKAHRWTEAERKELSNNRMGIVFTEEHKNNISKGKKGTKLSKSHKGNISKALRGRAVTWGDKISESKKGVHTPAMQKQTKTLIEWRRNQGSEFRPSAKLTIEQVRQIRVLLLDGLSLNSIARQFGVSKRTILFIKQEKTWKNV